MIGIICNIITSICTQHPATATHPAMNIADWFVTRMTPTQIAILNNTATIIHVYRMPSVPRSEIYKNGLNERGIQTDEGLDGEELLLVCFTRYRWALQG